MYYPEKSQASVKSQHMNILKMKQIFKDPASYHWFLKMEQCMFLLCYRSVTEGTPPFMHLKKACVIT